MEAAPLQGQAALPAPAGDHDGNPVVQEEDPEPALAFAQSVPVAPSLPTSVS